MRNYRTALFFVCVAVVVGVLLMRQLDLELRQEFAQDQIKTFVDLANEPESKSQEELIGAIQYIKVHYPSGTKQYKGSTLDSIVERVRQFTILSLEVEQKNRRNGQR